MNNSHFGFNVLIFSLLIFLSGCFSPWTGDEATITLNLGSGNSRTVISDETLNRLKHTIVLTGSAKTKTLYHTGAGTITAVVDPGNWNITVTAYLGGTLYAKGSQDMVVKAGQNNAVTVYMTILDLTYQIGDIGPGGGKIFHADTAGFVMTDTGEICRYLEAAPDDWYDVNDPGDPVIAWAEYSVDGSNPTPSYLDVASTETAIGTGRNNTLLMLASGDTPAAEACRDYENNGKNDWFLPSIEELNQLYENRNYAGVFVDDAPTTPYYSSSQNSSNPQAVDSRYFDDGREGTYIKDYRAYIRPIRAF